MTAGALLEGRDLHKAFGPTPAFTTRLTVAGLTPALAATSSSRVSHHAG